MTKGKEVERDGFQIRRTTVENGVPLFNFIRYCKRIN